MIIAELQTLYSQFLLAFLKNLADNGTFGSAREQDIFLAKYATGPCIMLFNGLARPSKNLFPFAHFSYYRGELRWHRALSAHYTTPGRHMEAPMVAVKPTLNLTAKSEVVVAGVNLLRYLTTVDVAEEAINKTALKDFTKAVTESLVRGFNDPDGYWAFDIYPRASTTESALVWTTEMPCP